MRASRQAGRAGHHVDEPRDRRREARRGSFEIVARLAQERDPGRRPIISADGSGVGGRSRSAPGRRASAPNTARVSIGMPGLTRTARQRRAGQGGAQPLADPLHHAHPPREAHGHVCACLRAPPRRPRGSSRARSFGAGEQAQRRRRVGRAAADTGRHRQPLRQPERAEPQVRDARGERAGRPSGRDCRRPPRAPPHGVLRPRARARRRARTSGSSPTSAKATRLESR